MIVVCCEILITLCIGEEWPVNERCHRYNDVLMTGCYTCKPKAVKSSDYGVNSNDIDA